MHKNWRQQNREKKVFKRRRKTRDRKGRNYHYSKNHSIFLTSLKLPIEAPKDFRFVENPFPCLVFFNQIRNKTNISKIKGQMTIRISLLGTEQIDFATISILKSIFEEFKYYGVNFRSNYPRDEKCRNYLLESGYFNNMYDSTAREINIPGKGKYFALEKKEGKVTIKDLKSFDKMSAEAYEHIQNKQGYSDEIISLLKEVGGNAVEWSDSYNKLWQIGVYFKKRSVVFTVSDLGRGIRDSLYVSRKLQALDFFTAKSDLDIVNRAFERKYGSLSQEINRNRGLPLIKRTFDEGKIANLIVCTNNVLINFSKPKESVLLNKQYVNFSGTFYQWELNKTCLI